MTNIRNQSLNSQKTLHTSPSQASSGIFIMRILEKIERVIMALHGTLVIEEIHHAIYGVRSIEFDVYGELSNINYTA